MDIVKIIGHPVMNSTNLNHIPMKLKIGRKRLTITLIIEKRRKTHVVDAVMTRPQAINVGTVMERKCKSLQKKSRLILIPTQNPSEGRH